MPFSDITCDRCGEHWASTLLWGNFRYRLDDGRECDADRKMGWCGDCNSLVPMERLPTQDEVEQEITRAAVALRNKEVEVEKAKPQDWATRLGYRAKLRDWEFHSRDKLTKSTKWLVEALALETLLTQRTTPERCMKCGSVNCRPVDFSDTIKLDGQAKEPVKSREVHPGCGGVLCLSSSEMRVSLVEKDYRFDQQGSVILG